MYLTVPRGKRRRKYEDRWLTGLFLGLVSRTSEVIVGTEKGCFKVSSIKRLSEQQSSNPELLEKLKGLPWKPRPNDSGDNARSSRDAENDYDVGPALDTGPVVDEEELPPMPTVSDPVHRVHNFYIRREVELREHGYTPGCQGCDAAREDRAPRRHSDECRKRIEEAVAAKEDESGARLALTRARQE